MIWFDRTQRSIVAGCHRCGAREVLTGQGPADDWGRAHVLGHEEVDAARERTRVLASLNERTRRAG